MAISLLLQVVMGREAGLADSEICAKYVCLYAEKGLERASL